MRDGGERDGGERHWAVKSEGGGFYLNSESPCDVVNGKLKVRERGHQLCLRISLGLGMLIQ